MDRQIWSSWRSLCWSFDQQLQSILQGLGDIAKGIISSQMDFTEAYCDPSLKDSLINKLSDKQSVLSNALNENKGKTL